MKKSDAIKLLAIDDKPDNLTTLSAVVRDALSETLVLTATNVRAGMELAVAEDPDVILLDMVMPGMDGFEVCRRLKADDRIKDIPVLFLTALKPEPAGLVEALEAGFEGFLAKPLEGAELIAQIRAMAKINTANRRQRTEKDRLEALVAERTRELTDEAARWRLLMEHSRDGIVILDQDGQVYESNRKFAEMLGYPHDSMGQLNVRDWEFMHPPEHVMEMVRSADAKGDHFETKHRRRDGSLYNVEISTNAAWFAGQKLILCICRDINDRRAAEEETRRFKTIADNAVYGKAMTDLEGNLVYINRFFAEIHGYSPAELIGKNLSIFHTASQLENVDNTISLLHQDGYFSPCEVWHVQRNGTEFPMLMSGILLRDDHGTPQYLATSAVDIRELKQVEEALRESEALQSRSQEIAHLGSWKLDLTTNRLIWSDEIYRIFGCKPQEFSATYKGFLDFVHPDDRDAVDEAYSFSLREGNDSYDIEHRILRRNTGEVRYVHEHCVHERDAAGIVIQSTGMMQDITERKLAENYREMGREVLRILNESGDLQESIQSVLAALKTRTGVDAVGLRLQEGEDFSYFVQDGFPKDFLLTENTLLQRGKDGGVCRDEDGSVRLECTCGLVISGKTDPSHPLFTRGGSCWTNDSFLLLDLPSDQDPRPQPRNNCIHQGYASVALIPVRTKVGIVGLIQFNDKRKGRFTLESIEMLEDIAAHIGSALMRKQAQLALEQKNEELEQFVYSVSHDLKSPLVTVKTFVGMLRKDLLNVDPPQISDDLNYIDKAADKMGQLLDALLRYSRIGRTDTPAQTLSAIAPVSKYLNFT